MVFTWIKWNGRSKGDKMKHKPKSDSKKYELGWGVLYFGSSKFLPEKLGSGSG